MDEKAHITKAFSEMSSRYEQLMEDELQLFRVGAKKKLCNTLRNNLANILTPK